MAGKRNQYKVVGRYMRGREVVAYHLVSLDGMSQGMFSREQVALLVGRDQIVNCTGRLTSTGFTLCGVGINIDQLPIKYIDKPQSVKDNTTNKVVKLTIVGLLKSQGRLIGYMMRCNDGSTRKVGYQQSLQAAKRGMIGNATVSSHNGTLYIKGVGCDLSKLPVINIDNIRR